MAYANHAPSRHSSYAHEVDSYVRPTSPVRPSSVSKVSRQAVYPGKIMGTHVYLARRTV